MMQTMIQSSSNRHLILDLDGNCLYSTLDGEKEDLFISSLKKEISKSKNIPRRSFFLTLENQLYSIRSSFSEKGTEPYIIFRVMPSKIPLSHSKYGITIMDKEQARQSFVESYYSNTELARDIISVTDQIALSDMPLMITGEIGTGKDRVACLSYAKSHRCDNPLYVINCALLNDKTWNFMINHYNSPFTDNDNTIYISNLGVLSPQRQKQLLSIILETSTAYISGETIETILKEESMLFPASHPSHAMTHTQPQSSETLAPAFALNLDQSLDKISQDIVLHVLTLCDGNQTAAAKRLGISRTTLWRYINR